ncbi:MAG TPA: hypothetical protein VHX60_02095 [Acidobacteriaceae bacterium]|jgi:hypothetical protein|nr:hypothetical protein [Acidobacteriaceae bacterium]
MTQLNVKLALLAALPAEIVMFGLFAYPVGVGFTRDDKLITRCLGRVWLVLHWPGVVSHRWLEQHSVSALSEILVFFIGGYLNMFLLMVAVLFVFRWLLRHSQQARSVHSH